MANCCPSRCCSCTPKKGVVVLIVVGFICAAILVIQCALLLEGLLSSTSYSEPVAIALWIAALASMLFSTFSLIAYIIVGIGFRKGSRGSVFSGLILNSITCVFILSLGITLTICFVNGRYAHKVTAYNLGLVWLTFAVHLYLLMVICTLLGRSDTYDEFEDAKSCPHPSGNDPGQGRKGQQGQLIPLLTVSSEQ